MVYGRLHEGAWLLLQIDMQVDKMISTLDSHVCIQAVAHPKSRREPGTRMSVLLANPDYLLEGFAEKRCHVSACSYHGNELRYVLHLIRASGLHLSQCS